MKQLLLIRILSIVCAALGLEAAAANSPPNMIFLMTDDQGWGDVAYNGHPKIKTPNLDAMAKAGIRFDRFYAGASVCSPTRASCLTGRCNWRVNINTPLRADEGHLPQEEITLPEALKEKGYATGHFGKWHLGDHPDFMPTSQGFDHYFGIPYSNDMNRKEVPLPLVRDLAVVEDSVHRDTTITARYTAEAERFIKANKDNPFFLYLPHTAVHGPLTPGAKFKGKSQDGPYGDWVQEIDWSMGKLFKVLEETGIDDNTLVLFTSDNGSAREKQGSNLPLRGRKGRTDEGGMRVPCIVRWPGKIPAGISSGALTCTMDLLPTMARLSGGKAPSDRVIDGKDIWPILSGKNVDADPRDAFFYYQMDQLQAVRSGDWKLFLAMDSKKRNWGKPEGKKELKLFNLAKDIHEDTDVASANPKVVKQLLAYAEAARKDLGDTNRPGKGQRKAGWVDKASPRLLAK